MISADHGALLFHAEVLVERHDQELVLLVDMFVHDSVESDHLAVELTNATPPVRAAAGATHPSKELFDEVVKSCVNPVVEFVCNGAIPESLFKIGKHRGLFALLMDRQHIPEPPEPVQQSAGIATAIVVQSLSPNPPKDVLGDSP